MSKYSERRHFERTYKDVTLSAKRFRQRIGCDKCKRETATEAFLGWNGTLLWICGTCITSLQKHNVPHAKGESDE